MPFRVPILLLAFNRPEHTRAVLARIREVAPAVLYVHCDGPRAGNVQEAERVAAVRQCVAEMVTWPCTLHTLYREQNLGLRHGVYGALNWFFAAEPEGIVLEDDCVPDPSFFPYCEELLARYRDDETVMHIAGSNLAEGLLRTRDESYFFSRFSLVWGWAGWRRAWEKMRIDLDGLDAWAAQGGLQTPPGSRMAQQYMLDKFRATRAGKLSSWGYAWFYSILINKGLCIVPRINLVQNVGVGEEGATHTTRRDKTAELRAGSLGFPLKHPAKTIDPWLELQLFYHTQKRRARLFPWYLLKKIGLR